MSAPAVLTCPQRVSGAPSVVSVLLGFLTLLAATLTVVAVAAPAGAAIDPCGAGGNKISCENSKPGTPASVWDDGYGAGSDAIQGFATQISTNLGGRVDFKIKTAARAYSITVYRTGWYGGDGARQIATVTPSAPLPQVQPACMTEAATELYDCGNWGVSASWTVPTTAVSGVYIARLLIPSTGEASHITFVVRDDASTSDVVFQTSDPTWQAYNAYGGSNFYRGGANGRAYKVSYNRPFATRGGTEARDFYFAGEYPAVRFLERNGYDVTYIAGVDTDRSGQLLRNHKTFLSVGHDEYWSGPQRANIESARDAGVNLQFLTGNEGYWRSRYEPSIDASRTAYRTLVSYKETWGNAKIDPSPQWTGTWRDPRFAPPSQGGGLPENSLAGTLYQVNDDDLAVKVSEVEGKLRLWRGTSLTSLPAGGQATLAPHTVGYESNEDIDNGFRPPGLVRLSTTVGPTPQYLTDFGNTVVPGTTTHHLTMYRAPSGALVFSAGSVQWSWGLDSQHDSPWAPEPADARMQQAQVNLLADMSAQPTTLMSGLVAATRSTDTVGPTVSIATPAAGASRANGAQLTVTGTATDTGGGRVAGVEVSTDAGDTWHPATSGTSSWSYTYVQKGVGATPIRVRATDDSANIGPVVTRSVTVTCPCSVFGASVPVAPALATTDDASGTELGLRFSPDSDGFVTGVRFYKGTGNGGTHTGSLWSAAGNRLATVTFTGESATGWQTAGFATPVAVTAGQTYVVSYTAPQGRYASQVDAFFARPLLARPLSVAGGYGAAPAGVFANAGSFPTGSFRNSNYFVDAVFSTGDDSPLSVNGRSPDPGASSVPRTTAVRGTFSKPVTASTVAFTLRTAAGASVPGATEYDAATRTATFTPSAPLGGGVVHTATLAATATVGGGQVASNGSWSFTAAQPAGPVGVCPCSLFSDDTAPGTAEAADTDPVTLGVRFSPDADGTVTAIRFHKAPGNTGTHTGTLWSADGTQLATGTFAGESTSGWQTLVLAAPVSVTAGSTYVAGYRTTVGRYSLTSGAFAAADLSRGPLRVTSTAGAFTYGTGFPSSTSSSSYLVDVVFARASTPLAIASRDPGPGAGDVPRGSPVQVELTQPIRPGATLAVTAGGSAVAGTTSLSNDGTRLTTTPAAALPADAVVTVELSGVQGVAGGTLATTSWSFRTAPAAAVVAQTIFGDALPAVAAEGDTSAIEVGTAFTPTRDGTVRGFRFYKGAGNGGTHVGSLWNAAGQRLARATYANETATGWQRVALVDPVRVTAGQTYVVSYLAPQGRYSSSAGYFATARTSGQLTAPAGNNGRYLYGAAGGMPTGSYRSTSYFVDVEFVPDAASITVTARNPVSSATGVDRDVRPSITFNAAVQPGATMTLTRAGQAIAGSTTLSTDARKLTFTPTAPLPADTVVTATVTGVTSTEGAALADQSWTFRTTEAATSTTTVMFDGLTPGTAAVDDGDAVELGVSFVPSVAGQVTGIRFYKGPGNTGTHTGTLWSAAGAVLATGTFDTETATGWQTMDLDAPVGLTAGQTYVVSYLAPNGRYSATGGFFSGGWSSGPLSVAAAGNGRYRYGSGGGFPTSTYNATNYFVGVVFRQP